MKIYKNIVLCFAFVAVLGIGASVARADSSTLSGWAWSSTIGWLSFNSADSGAGGGPYSVNISTSTVGSDIVGALSGYAWSPNIGWVSFNNQGDWTGCPSGSCPPTIDMTTGAVSGWIRALAGVGRTDGWDGWIELSDSGLNAKHPTGDTSGNGGSSLTCYIVLTGGSMFCRLRLGRSGRRVVRLFPRLLLVAPVMEWRQYYVIH